MMYHVLIVDDEPMIRQGMPALIQWETYGFSVIASACDGDEAFSLCQNEDIHLLLTDIRMPNSDGLQLIEKIRSQHPHILCVVLSGYSEFDYARQALNLGVYRYLLKPINPAELVSVLEDAKAILDAQAHSPAAAYLAFIDESLRKTDKRSVHEMIHYVDDHLGQGITLEQLGDHFNFSSVYISQLFKREVGTNFVDWLTLLRIEKAKVLLQDITMKNYTVAAQVGYNDVRYFGQIFKRIVGVTPADYRNHVKDHT